MKPKSRSPFEVLRRFLLPALFLGLVGTGCELLLVGHTEDPWQWIPMILLAAATALLALLAVAPHRALLRTWQGLMLLFLAGGLLGLGLHWKGKMEFKSESNPSLTGFRLFWEALQSKSPPPLAPGVMIQLGLLGLAYAYRHPALAVTSESLSDNKGEDE